MCRSTRSTSTAAERERTIDQFLNVFFALLFLSEVIAVLGIVNTLMLSVYERTRELGLLRVVGMTRRQVRRMIRGESVVISVIGTIIGLFVGLLWGWAVVTALSGQFVDEFSVPTTQLAVFVVVFADRRGDRRDHPGLAGVAPRRARGDRQRVRLSRSWR